MSGAQGYMRAAYKRARPRGAAPQASSGAGLARIASADEGGRRGGGVLEREYMEGGKEGEREGVEWERARRI